MVATLVIILCSQPLQGLPNIYSAIPSTMHSSIWTVICMVLVLRCWISIFSKMVILVVAIYLHLFDSLITNGIFFVSSSRNSTLKLMFKQTWLLILGVRTFMLVFLWILALHVVLCVSFRIIGLFEFVYRWSDWRRLYQKVIQALGVVTIYICFLNCKQKTSCSGILGHGILYGAETGMMGNSSKTYN